MTRIKKKIADIHKGQRRGVCGHFMPTWDTHSSCPGCRKKFKGQDPCVEDRDCASCNQLSVGQLHLLRTSRTHESRSPRRRASPVQSHSPSRVRGRAADRRSQNLQRRSRSPVHRSTGHRSTGHRSGQDMTGHYRSTGHHRSDHRSTGQTTGQQFIPTALNIRKGL